jgi:hypothetical protein
MSDRPTIGDFRSVPANSPRGSMITSETPPAQEAPAAPEEKTEEVSLAEAAVPEPEKLTPAERYRARLAEAKISFPVATAIYDAILDKGYYEEYVKIRAHRAVFRTRSYEEQLRVQTALELAQPRMAISQEELVSRYNLAASLYEWQGKAIKHETDDDFENAMKMIRKMPAPLVGLLYDALAKFDTKIMIIFSEGATDSF